MAKDNLQGQRFGRLIVINEAKPHYQPNGTKRTMWNCICDCGNKCVVSANNLKQGKTKSCGCFHSEQASKSRKKFNKYNLNGDYGICYGIHDEKILFDIEDYDKIKNIRWGVANNGYVNGYVKDSKMVSMHRFIMNCPKGLTVDHINHNPLDNRKCNLRIATYSQQEMNKSARPNNPHGIKGIYLTKSGKWDVQLRANGVSHRKYVNTKEEAIKLRKKWEEKYFKEYNYKEG